MIGAKTKVGASKEAVLEAEAALAKADDAYQNRTRSLIEPARLFISLGWWL